MAAVALLGARGTGKTRLAQELAAHLRDHAVTVVEAETLPAGRFDAVLLMGLDLPGAPADDTALRNALQQAGISFQVVYGSGPQRLASALAALRRAGVAAPEAPPPAPQRPWKWLCEKCSDPECEHRLFRGLG